MLFMRCVRFHRGFESGRRLREDVRSKDLIESRIRFLDLNAKACDEIRQRLSRTIECDLPESFAALLEIPELIERRVGR